MTPSKFNQKVSKIENLLFGFAMKLTGNRENAKDLMQETLMRSYKNREKFKEGTNFKAWLTTIMYNSYVNVYRRKKTRMKVMRPMEDYNYLVENKSAEGNPSSVMFMKELKGIVNKLSDDFRIPFQLHVEGYQYDEISERMDLPMGTVKSRIFYARKKLMGMVSERYDVSTLMAA